MKRNDFFEMVWSWKVNPVNLVNLEILVSAQANLNRLLRILRALILFSRVVGGTLSLAAAPKGPETRPRLPRNAASMIFRSSSRSLPLPRTFDTSTEFECRDGFLESHDSSTRRISPEVRITDLSMTFCNSRILPGQSLDSNSSSVF